MFENLTGRFQAIFSRLTGKSRLDEKSIREALREVRLAFLEADVNIKATKEFCQKVEDRALGAEILKGLNPAQQVIKIVHEAMIELLGGKEGQLDLPPGEARIMLVGLQGSGKTTTAAKLAKKLIAQGRKPLLCAGDIYRPAAIKQLEVVGEKAGVPVFQMGTDVDPVEIARQGSKKAYKEGLDTIILDTAGRLHIDDEMMAEVQRIKQSWKPTHIILVVDSMVGQDAINQAQHFHEGLGITGTILTKLDSDTRGGAALSIRYVTGRPILFAGMGEKLDDLEPFFPDRMASRILGMGDVLTLIEKAKQAYNEEEAMNLQKKLLDQTFTLDDFLNQISQVKKMGGIGNILTLLPGMGGTEAVKNISMSEDEMKYVEAMILSMTPEERSLPHLINGSRKRRIAMGSGTTVQDVNRLLKQFVQTRQMMSMMAGAGKKKGKKPKMSKKLMKKMMNMRGMFPGV
ncbi:MAG TPA: signal recognition particle protein [bacterium]|nr:signal recognition particle protein [Candidatus Omnitrophota bacterium]HOJ59244.1 signal recognition particle protein [bacterium]HOL93787.1 signal recognition particle protein [bacterium]HPP00874.1 signal recognition particle protein [bacterium]HXK94510.1 signal recognition particle protein [bacterium]